MPDDDYWRFYPFADAHAVFRAFLLADPSADVEWTLAADGTTDVLMSAPTERAFRRWHEAVQAALCVPDSRGCEQWVWIAPCYGPPV
jgi:hypothetical protein